jgi:hypothetical protein
MRSARGSACQRPPATTILRRTNGAAAASVGFQASNPPRKRTGKRTTRENRLARAQPQGRSGALGGGRKCGLRKASTWRARGQVSNIVLLNNINELIIGGEGGIRTPDTVARMPHFECGAFNHSATSPVRPQIAARHNSRKRPLVHPSGASPAQPPIPCGSCSRRPMRLATPPAIGVAHSGACDRGSMSSGAASAGAKVSTGSHQTLTSNSASTIVPRHRDSRLVTTRAAARVCVGGAGRSAEWLSVTAISGRPRGAAARAECRKM